jgi:hypothetical protein
MKFIYNHFSKKPYKPFYNAFVPRAYRKQWHYNYHEIPQQQKVAEYWQQTIKDYFADKIEKFNLQPKQQELVGQKIIWQYWSQGLDDLPEIVKICFCSVEKYKNDYKVIRITDETLSEYIELPTFINTKRADNTFRPVFFSDLLRNALIYIYGGVWLDASILLTDKFPDYLADLDFFMFSRDNRSKYKHWAKDNGHFYFNWNEEFKVNFLSSIIFGKPKNKIAKVSLDLLLYFWKNENSIPHYFFYQILLNELKQSKYVDFNFPVVDDALPHLLQRVINQPFNEDEYRKITQSITFHKLDLHASLKQKKFVKMTNFGKLKQDWIC